MTIKDLGTVFVGQQAKGTRVHAVIVGDQDAHGSSLWASRRNAATAKLQGENAP